MDKRQVSLESECSVSNDLKVEVIDSSAVSCISDKISYMDKTIEDKNKNITILNSKGKFGVDEKQIPTSSKKEIPNIIGLHVGPNGLINGLEIENSGSISHFLENIPKSEMHEPVYKSSPSQTTQKLLSERNCLDSRTSEQQIETRTDSVKTSTEPESSSVSEQGSVLSSHGLCGKGEGKTCKDSDIEYMSYKSELQMPDIMSLIQKDLSEPYSIYTYRYFIHNWPNLCFLVSALIVHSPRGKI